MKEYISILKTAPLFRDVDSGDFETMLDFLGAEIKNVRKGETVLLAGDKPNYVGIVLSGQLHIIREDYDGNRSLLAAISPGDIFAEALCCAGVSESPVTVAADVDSTVMMLDFLRIVRTYPGACKFGAKLNENMLGLIAKKNLHLQSRMEIISMKSIRAKVVRYLETYISEKGREFVIPFNREELADYLCVERSALSHELSRMKRDGLIEYKKNRFIVK